MFQLILLAATLGMPARVQDGDSVPGRAVVSGRVVDAVTGRPIAGVIVTPAGSAAVISAAAPLPSRALTNRDGLFVLRDLRKGSLALTAAKNGYADATYNQ